MRSVSLLDFLIVALVVVALLCLGSRDFSRLRSPAGGAATAPAAVPRPAGK